MRKLATVSEVMGGQAERRGKEERSGGGGAGAVLLSVHSPERRPSPRWWHQPAAVQGPSFCLPPWCAMWRTAGLKWSLTQRALLWINWPGLRGNSWNAFLKDTHINIVLGVLQVLLLMGHALWKWERHPRFYLWSSPCTYYSSGEISHATSAYSDSCSQSHPFLAYSPEFHPLSINQTANKAQSKQNHSEFRCK